MVIVIDNYDSFTYNLVQRLGEIDPAAEIRVYRNDNLSLAEIDAMSPSRILVSPGPCTPNEAGISVDCIKRFAGRVPIWVCAWVINRLVKHLVPPSFVLRN